MKDGKTVHFSVGAESTLCKSRAMRRQWTSIIAAVTCSRCLRIMDKMAERSEREKVQQ